MVNKENIDQEVDKTLQSLDGLDRAVANPFLFTRIKARMVLWTFGEKQNSWYIVTSFLSRPVVAIAILAAVVAINSWAVFGTTEQISNQEKESIAITDIADEYNLVANNNYYYENIPAE